MPPAPAQDVARRILGRAWWAGFTFNGITATGDGHDSMIGGDALSDGEREALLELCRQRPEAFREHPDQRLGERPGWVCLCSGAEQLGVALRNVIAAPATIRAQPQPLGPTGQPGLECSRKQSGVALVSWTGR